jgi:transcriptional regulator with XRE-family HTH domain
MVSTLHRTWGRNMRATRVARELTMDDLAAKLGVTVATVSRWETGAMAPRDEKKVRIATVLDIDVRTLFPLDGSLVP